MGNRIGSIVKRAFEGMGFLEEPVAYTTTGKQIEQRAFKEAEENDCPSCGGSLRPIFTWNTLRPYYLTCDRCDRNEHE